MLRYILVAILIGTERSDAYRSNHPRRQQYLIPASGYDDYDYDYLYPAYGKDTDAANKRPTIFSYWNNIFRNARLPRFNITNPFSKLFTPYVIKVDFPPPSDDIDEPTTKPTHMKKKKLKKPQQQEDNIYLNVESQRPQLFYDAVTQQYYEVQQTASQEYNPENNYYATTFKDDDEIIIDFSNKNSEQENNEEDADPSEEQEDQEYMANDKETGIVGIYNTPVIKRFAEEHPSNDNNRRVLKRTKMEARHGPQLNSPASIK